MTKDTLVSVDVKMKVHHYGVLILGIIQLAVIVADTCDRQDVNGCSIPLGLKFFYKRTFTSSCNKHDVCYRCGSRAGYSQRRCDDIFRSNMRNACNSRRGLRRRTCRGFANVYYRAVRLFGHRKFRNPSLWYCSQSWVQNCL